MKNNWGQNELSVHKLRAIQTITFKSSEEALTSYTTATGLISEGLRQKWVW